MVKSGLIVLTCLVILWILYLFVQRDKQSSLRKTQRNLSSLTSVMSIYSSGHPHVHRNVHDELYRFHYYTNFLSFPTRMAFSFNSVQAHHPLEFPFPHVYLKEYKDLKKHIDLDRQLQPSPIRMTLDAYQHDLYEIWRRLPEKYHSSLYKLVWYPHDRVERFDYPILVKTRCTLKNPNKVDKKDIDVSASFGLGSILLKLNTPRHFRTMEHIFENDQLMFHDKKSMLIWRGNTTGYGFTFNNVPYRSVSRKTLIETWPPGSSKWIDVALTDSPHTHLSINDMLHYKYLLSVEGNDVASNLKWILASNSLCFMPTPQITSWFMEDHLEPWIHYIPVADDFSDLERQIEWAEMHPNECEACIERAHDFVRVFMDSEGEQRIQCRILKWYFDTFEWKR